jgi:membrane-associated phospholipid phosphatase
VNEILLWGLDVVRSVQSAIESPGMTVIMKGISVLGTEFFFFFVMPIVYWCIDARKGARLGFIMFGSAFINASLKELWAQPRPYNIDPSVGRAYEASHAFPSGHSQNSITFWGTFALWFRKPWGYVAAAIITFLIGFSRVYLGVHFPTDVLAGWGFGFLVVLFYGLFGERLGTVIARLGIRFQIILVAAIALLGNLINANDTSITGAFFGIGIAYALMRRNLHYSAKGTIAHKTIRFGLGILVALAIYVGFKAFLPKESENLYALGRFFRYSLLGLWIGFGAPWLFIKLGIAEGQKPDTDEKAATE